MFCIGITSKIFLSVCVPISYVTYLMTSWLKWHCINNPSNVWLALFSFYCCLSYINTAFKMRDQLEKKDVSYNMAFSPLYAKNAPNWIILILK